MLREPIHELVAKWDPPDGLASGEADTYTYQALVQATGERLPCRSLSLYVIHPGSGTYRRVASTGGDGGPHHIPALPRRCDDSLAASVQDLLWAALETGNTEEDIATFHRPSSDVHVAGLRYQQTIYAFLLVDQPRAYDDSVISAITGLAELAFLTSQNRLARNALRANERPIDITDDPQTFYSSLRQFLVEATGVQLIALREPGAPGTGRERTLRCTVVHGWDIPATEFDLQDYMRYPPSATP